VTRFNVGSLVAFGLLLCGSCARFEDRPLIPARSAAAIESRSLAEADLQSFLATNLHQTVVAWPPKEWNFDQLTLVALYFHPQLDIARARWQVAQAGVQTAAGRPNPSLIVTPEYSANPPSGASPWAPMVSIDVPIETAGKRGYRIARSAHLAEAARLQVVREAWQLRNQLQATLLERDAAQRRIPLLESQVKIGEEVVRSLDERLAAGAVSANELAAARIAAAKSRADLAVARSQLEEAQVALAAALGLPAAAIDGVEWKSNLNALDEIQPPAELDEWRREALIQRADIRAALAEYAAAQAALQLEIARQWPDVHLGPGYKWDQGESKWSVGASVELPLLNQNQGPIAEAEARRTEAAARFVAVQSEVLAQLEHARAAWRSAAERLRPSEDLLKAQRQQLARIESAQAAGAADRLAAGTARLELAAAELLRHDALVQAAHARGQLEAALQRPLDFLEAAALFSGNRTLPPVAKSRAAANRNNGFENHP